MKRKQVVFNYSESELLNYALSKDNFSEYVKSLIAEDKKKVVKPSIYELYQKKCDQL